MDFAPLPWHRPWLRRAREMASSHHHAWLLIGRTGDGAGHAAAALAAALLCLDFTDGAACGRCASCRWLAGDVHPDFRLLLPDLGDGETMKLPTIKVDAVREALEFMQLSASAEHGRVLLVDPATALPRDSGNALLKALEEPPPNTRWLLVAPHPERLLPTIRSRALKLAMPRPTHAQSVAWLQTHGVSAADATQTLLLSRGEPLSALALAQSDSGDARGQFIADLLRPRELPTLKWGAWVEAGQKTERRERFSSMLRLLLDWTSDWVRVRASLAPLVHVRHASALAVLAPGLPVAEGLRYHRALLPKLRLPDTTLSARLQFESILLDYRALFTR